MHRRRTRIRIVEAAVALHILCGLAATACAQVVLGGDRPFYRIVSDAAPSPPRIAIGWDNWTVLRESAPLAINDVRVPVAEDNTFRLGDAVDVSRLSSNAFGVVVAVDSVWGRNHHYVVTAGVQDAAEIRLSALPPALQTETQRRLRTVRAWVREVPDFPGEIRSEPVTLPKSGAHLSFGVGFEDIVDQAGIRELADDAAAEGRQTPTVVARVLLQSVAGETEVFARDVRDNVAHANHRRVQPFTVDIAAFSGHTVQFVFRFDSADERALPSPFAMPVWVNPVVRAAAPDSTKKNLLLISLDTLRADHLGAYGYERATSPRLDEFAADAALFEDCISNSSWTTPAHASIFTGLSPILHGAGGPAGFRLREGAVTLAELARANGYLTAAFTQGHAIDGGLGFAQGFDQYSNGPPSGGLPQSDGRAEEIFEQGAQWLDEFGGNPFVLFLHTYEIHAPYMPPEAFRGRFTADPPGDGMPLKSMSDPAARERIVALYDEGIAYTDDVLGKFLDGMRESGLLDRTHVIIFSDHGEEFWEHGDVQHSFTLYQEQLHVPLIVRLAENDPPAVRIPQRVILSDLFATALELLGIEHARPRDSLSLVPLMRGADAAYPRTMFRAELYKENLQYFMIAALRGDAKYTAKTRYDRAASPLHEFILGEGTEAAGGARFPGEPELTLLRLLDTTAQAHPEVEEQFYDLGADPAELAPIDPGPRMNTLRRVLLDDLEQSAEQARQTGADVAAPSELTEAERERLRALGYVE